MLQTVKRSEENSSSSSVLLLETPPTINNVVKSSDHDANDEVQLVGSARAPSNIGLKTYAVSRSVNEYNTEMSEGVKVVELGHKRRIYAKESNINHRKRTIYCCVYNCRANSYESPHLTFFSFPETPLRCKVWTRFTKRRTIREMNIYELHSSSHRMCSAHFQINDFVDNKSRNVLVENAIPTVYDSKECPWFKDKDYKPVMKPEAVECVVPQVNVKETDKSPCHDSNKIDRWDLCEYHRLMMRSVTAVGTEVKDIKFCMKCGSSVHVPFLVARPNVYKICCKKDHEIIVTTEFNEKFRDYVVACQKGHRLRGASDPPCHSPCHLCNDHYVAPHAVNQQHNGERRPRQCLLPTPKKKRGRPAIRREEQLLPDMFPPLVNHLFHFQSTVKYTADVGVSCVPEREPEKVETMNRGTQISAGDLKGIAERNAVKELKKLRETIGHLEKNVTPEALAPVLTERYLIENILPKYCKGVTLKLMEMQVLFAVQHATRWPISLITLAKVIENECRPAYNIIRKLMRFPSRAVLNKFDLVPSKMSAVTFITETFDKKDEAIKVESPRPVVTVEEPARNRQVQTAKNVEETSKKLITEENSEIVKMDEEVGDDKNDGDDDDGDNNEEDDSDNIPQLSLPENEDTSSSAVTTILDEAIKELEFNEAEGNTTDAVVVDQLEEAEGGQNGSAVVLELMGGDSEMSRFRILGSAIQDYETGVYQILAESVDSPEHGVESLEVHVVPFDNNDKDE